MISLKKQEEEFTDDKVVIHENDHDPLQQS